MTALSPLVRRRDVSSTDLTRMYLERLKKHGPAAQLRRHAHRGTRARAGRPGRQGDQGRAVPGPAARDPMGRQGSVREKGILTTWGAAPYKNQVFDYDATVVERLREAGAVLVAKLSLGALAQGDNWFRGQTKNPWNGRGLERIVGRPGIGNRCRARRLLARDRDPRLDHFTVGRERRRRPESDLRTREPARRNGPQLDDGQDRADVPFGRGLRARLQRDLRA